MTHFIIFSSILSIRKNSPERQFSQASYFTLQKDPDTVNLVWDLTPFPTSSIVISSLLPQSSQLEDKGYHTKDRDDGCQSYLRAKNGLIIFNKLDRTISGNHYHLDAPGNCQSNEQQMTGQNNQGEFNPSSEYHFYSGSPVFSFFRICSLHIV
jgi:hypothetical protein